MEGFGAHSRIHTARLMDLSPDLPIVVEIVDDEAKIQGFFRWWRRWSEKGS
jgi:uncharacterized protein